MARISLALFLGCALAAFACRKGAGPSSPDWERARSLHVELVARYADEAYGLPQMDEVLALLERVPQESIDAPEATALKERILEERKRLASQQSERQRLLSAAGPGSWSPPSTGAASAVVAAAPMKPALAPGLELGVFREAYGDCFEPRTQLRIEGPDGGVLTEKGEAFGLRPEPGCKEQHAQLADKLVLFADGKLLAIRPASDVKAVEQEASPPPGPPVMVEAEMGPDGKLVPKRGPDGGYILAKDAGQ